MPIDKKSDIAAILENAAVTQQERESVYGTAYKRGGSIMGAFFPNGIELKTPSDFQRYHIFVFCVAKMNRYAESLTSGGHKDSAHDLVVYAAMLENATDGGKE